MIWFIGMFLWALIFFMVSILLVIENVEKEEKIESLKKELYRKDVRSVEEDLQRFYAKQDRSGKQINFRIK